MRTIVGLFDTFEHAQSTFHDLESAGIDSGDISVIAHGDVIHHGRGSTGATGAGTAIGAGLGLLAGLAAIAIPGVGPVMVLGPMLAGGLMGAVAGGLVGSLVDAGVPAEEAEYYTEGVRRGGTLVVVNAKDDDAPRVIAIINRHHPVDLEERMSQWRESGWVPVQQPEGVDFPDPTGHTTMGDAADRMPSPHFGSARKVDAADFEESCRENFDHHYPGGTYTWEECAPAYEFGSKVAGDACGKEWDSIEHEVRTRWEKDHPGTWNRIKDAARFGYDRAKQRN